ncbi:MAG: hypothetical protein ACFFD4_24275 [Candidatus Odinarchaeota archaeon]
MNSVSQIDILKMAVVRQKGYQKCPYIICAVIEEIDDFLIILRPDNKSFSIARCNGPEVPEFESTSYSWNHELIFDSIEDARNYIERKSTELSAKNQLESLLAKLQWLALEKSITKLGWYGRFSAIIPGFDVDDRNNKIVITWKFPVDVDENNEQLYFSVQFTLDPDYLPDSIKIDFFGIINLSDCCNGNDKLLAVKGKEVMLETIHFLRDGSIITDNTVFKTTDTRGKASWKKILHQWNFEEFNEREMALAVSVRKTPAERVIEARKSREALEEAARVRRAQKKMEREKEQGQKKENKHSLDDFFKEGN